MERRILHFVTLLLTLVAVGGGAMRVAGAEGEKEKAFSFTEWTPKEEFEKFLRTKDVKNDAGKNYWDQGHWIQAVEFRWVDGKKEYRISIAESPKGKGFWWMWFLDMDEEFFQQRMKSLEADGFQMSSYHAAEDPAGKRVFAATWSKVAEKRVKGD